MYSTDWPRRGSMDSSDDSSRHSSLPASLQAHLFPRPATTAAVGPTVTPNHPHIRRTPSSASDSEGSMDGDDPRPATPPLLSPAVFGDDLRRQRPMRPWEEVDKRIHHIPSRPYPPARAVMHDVNDREAVTATGPYRNVHQRSSALKHFPSHTPHDRLAPYHVPFPQHPPPLLPNIVRTPPVKERRPLPPLMTSEPTRTRPSLTPLISIGPHPDKNKFSITEGGVNHLSPERQPLACIFCRSRKIACKRPDKSAADQTCNQCVRRGQSCAYPTKSRRGLHRRKLRVGVVPACDSDKSSPVEIEVVLARARTNTSASASSASSSVDVYNVGPNQDRSRSPYQDRHFKRRRFESDDSAEEYEDQN